MDEMDLLLTKKQTIFYSFFDWTTRKKVPLVILGISNTMNLPEQLAGKIQSRLGTQRITFETYTKVQLEKIIKSRLEGLEAFDSSALLFCSMKIAAVSGDARRALELCR
jgi:origin recognition complex subunit 1